MVWVVNSTSSTNLPGHSGVAYGQTARRRFVGRTHLALFLLFATCFAVPCVSPAVRAAPPDRVAVRCPALEVDERRRSNHPGEPAGPVELVVMGTPRDLGPAPENARCHRFELSVDTVLYGHWDGGPLTFRSFRTVATDHRQIFSLATSLQEGGLRLELKAVADENDLAAQKALAEVRWDWHVLAARAILVGHAAPGPATAAPGGRVNQKTPNRGVVRSADEPRKNEQIRIVVDRWLSGKPDKLSDSTLTVELDGYPRRGGESILGNQQQIFFVRAVDASPDEHAAVWHVAYRQPVALVDAVNAALQRRAKYPIVEAKVDRGTERFQEISWHGTLPEAIQLLASPTESAVILAQQRLAQSRKESIPLVVREIERLDRLDTTVRATSPVRHLSNLIRTLGFLEEHRSDGELAKLLERILGDIIEGRRTAPEALAMVGDVPPSPTTDAAFHDNHSLVWMLDALDEPLAAKRFGARLVEARKSAPAAWRSEIEWALAQSRIEDHLELQAAAAHTHAVTPLRSSKSLWHDGQYEVAFSPSGQWLATVGNDVARIWRTADWGKEQEFELTGSIATVVFSLDEQHLLVAGERNDRGLLERVQWRTGKTVQSWSSDLAPLDEIALSADQKLLVTASDTEERLRVWQWPEAQQKRAVPLAEGAANFALRPDGAVLLREVHAHSWRIERLDDKPAPREALAVRSVVFSPDSEILYSAERPGTLKNSPAEEADNPAGLTGEPYVIRARDADDDFAPLEARSELVSGHGLVIAAEGRRLVVVAPRETTCGFTTLELPSLKTISRFQLPLNVTTGRVEAAVLSPDGATLVVSLEDQPPVLFNTETGQRLIPGPGHGGRIISLAFDDDGQTLQTVDDEGWECTWDAADLRIIKRGLRPVEAKPTLTRASSEGQLTEDGQSLFRIQLDPRGRTLEVHVFDVATGTKRKLGDTPTPWLPVGPRGLVPGGRYFHAGTQIYDRQTLKLYSSNRLRGMDVQRMTFTADGSRYALVTVDRPGPESDVREPVSDRTTWIRVHATSTGKTQWAFPATDGGVQQLAFSPDGKRLAVVLDDNSLQIWALPAR